MIHGALIDYRAVASSQYEVHRVLAYGGVSLGERPIFTPESRGATAVIPVVGSSWESTSTRHAAPAIGPDGNLYTAYIGVGPSGFQIGIASASDIFGTFTKSGDNPIVPTGDVGEPTDLTFSGPTLFWDVAAARWELLAGNLDSGTSEFAIYRWVNTQTVPTTGSDWSFDQLIVGPSGTGWRELGVNGPRVLKIGGIYHMYVVGIRASDPKWTVGLFTGTDLTSLTEHGNSPLLDGTAGATTTTTAAATDDVQLAVSSSTGFVEGGLCTITDDTTGTNFLLARVRRVVDSTTLEFEQGITIGSGARIFQQDREGLSPNAVIDLGAGASPRYVMALTAFGGGTAFTENSDGEWTAWATADAPEGPWTIDLPRSMPAPPPGAEVGGLGVARSWENMAWAVDPLAESAGYGLLGGFGAALSQGEKAGAGEFTGLDDGLFLAEGSKGGESEARAVQAPWVITHGEKGIEAYGLTLAHPYLLGEGEKSITAGIGYGLTFGHQRVLAFGAKEVPSYAYNRDRSYQLATSEKAGTGFAAGRGHGRLVSLGEKGAEGYARNLDPAFAFALSEKGGEGLGLALDHPYLLEFGQKVGGGTAAEGYAYLFQRGFAAALGSKGGESEALARASAWAQAMGVKIGTAGAFADDLAYLLAHGFKGTPGDGYGLAAGFPRLAARGQKGGVWSPLLDRLLIADIAAPASTGFSGVVELGQAFGASADARVYAVGAVMRKSSGAAGTIVAKLYLATGTPGSTAVGTGSPLWVSDPVDLATISSSVASLVRFPASAAPLAIRQGGIYALTFAFASGSGTVNVQGGIGGTHHAGNLVTFNQSAWVAVAGADIAFQLEGSVLLGYSYVLGDGEVVYLGPPAGNVVYVVPRNWIVEF